MDEIIERDNGNGEHGYGELLGEVKTRIRTAQYEALRAVNKELIDLCWNIGKLIVERQQGETWGYAVVERLAADIQTEFPGLRASRHATSGTCVISIVRTEVVKNCNQWLQK